MNETPQKAATTNEPPIPSDLCMEVVDDAMAAVLRQKSACERLQIADRMWIGARSVICASVLSQSPTWTVDEVNRAIVRRVLGKDFPDDARCVDADSVPGHIREVLRVSTDSLLSRWFDSQYTVS